MNEEIDIIELLKRVKEGKAPKEIEINGNIYNYKGFINIQYMYENNVYNMFSEGLNFNTKIKILDKPIIEECDEIDLQAFKDDEYVKAVIRTNRKKLNEIIKFLNNKE